MKIILSIIFMLLAFFANAQNSKYETLTIVGAINNTIETQKEYLLLPKNKNKKVKITASGCGVEIIFKNNKYYIITTTTGEFMTSVSLNGKALGPPSKFTSIKK